MTRRLTGQRVAALVAAAALGLGPVGCAQLRDALGVGTPTARVVGARLTDVGLDAATLTFEVEVANPLDLPLPLANLDYNLASQGQPFLAGKAPLQGAVEARGRKTVALPAKVTYGELLRVLKDVRPGSVVPYVAELGLSVDVPAAGPLRLPLKQSGNLPVPAAPEVEVKEVTWSEIGLNRAAGRAVLGIVNRNQFPVDLSAFAYALSLGGMEVARSSLAQAVPLKADGGAGVVEIPLAFSPRNMGLAVLNLISGKGSGYGLKGTVDIGTPFGPMSLPVEKVGETTFRK